MSAKPRLLDLFSDAGGSAVGYHRTGFEVVGVDIVAQPHYPFEHHVADALTFTLEGFDAVHASPPCQFYSAMSNCRPEAALQYPDLIGPTRERLEASGLPYVIENVEDAAPWMRDPTMLCGQMFGLELYRHRLFEASFPLPLVMHPGHTKAASKAGHWRPGTIISVAGGGPGTAEKRRAMGVDWMTRDELAQAIPPAYTEWLGARLLEVVR